MKKNLTDRSKVSKKDFKNNIGIVEDSGVETRVSKVFPEIFQQKLLKLLKRTLRFKHKYRSPS